MMNPGNPPPRAVQGDIDAAELSAMLQTIIEARCGLSAIHHLLDDARTMSDIRERFVQWQSERQEQAQRAGKA